MAATLGAYVVAALSAAALTLVLDGSAEERALAGVLPCFLVFAAAVLWSFAARSALRAWLGLAIPALVLAAITWSLLEAARP